MGISLKIYLPNDTKIISDKIFEDLKKHFEAQDIIIERDLVEFSYSPKANRFALTTKDDIYGIAFGNMELSLNNKSEYEIKTRDTDSETPISLVSIAPKQSFAISDAEVRKKINDVFYYLADNYNIEQSFYMLQGSIGDIKNNSFYSHQAVGRIDFEDESIPKAIKVLGTENNILNSSINSEEKLKDFQTALAIQNELTHKHIVVSSFLKTFDESYLREVINDFDKNQHTRQSELIDRIKEFRKLGDNANTTLSSKLAIQFRQNLNTTKIRKEVISGLLGEAADTNLMGEFRILYEHLEKYPNSSKKFTAYKEFLRNYSAENVENEIKSGTEIGNILKNNQRSFNFLVPQGFNLKNEELLKLNDNTDKYNHRQSIISPNFADKDFISTSGNINFYNISQKASDARNFYFEVMKMHKNDDDNSAIQYLDLNNSSISIEDTKKLIEFAANKATIYLANDKISEKLEKYANLSLDGDKKLYFSGIKNDIEYNIDFDENEENISFNYKNINDFLANNYLNCSKYISTNYKKPSEVSLIFQEAKEGVLDNFRKRRLLVDNSKTALTQIKTIASQSLNLDNLPVSITAKPVKLSKNKNDLNDILQRAWAEAAFSLSGYDIENLSNNPKRINPAFSAEGSIRNALYPSNIDLSNKTKKDMFYKICLLALDDYAKTMDTTISSDDIATQKALLHKILENEKLNKVLMTITQKTTKVKGASSIITPMEIYTALDRENNKIGTIPVPTSFIHNIMLKYKILEPENLMPSKLTDDNVDNIYLNTAWSFRNLSHYIDNTIKNKNSTFGLIANITKSLFSEVEILKGKIKDIDIVQRFKENIDEKIKNQLDDMIRAYTKTLFKYDTPDDLREKLSKIKYLNVIANKKENLSTSILFPQILEYANKLSCLSLLKDENKEQINAIYDKIMSLNFDKNVLENIKKEIFNFQKEQAHFEKSQNVIKNSLLYYGLIYQAGKLTRNTISAINTLSRNLEKESHEEKISLKNIKFKNELEQKIAGFLLNEYGADKKTKHQLENEIFKNNILAFKQELKDDFASKLQEKYEKINGLRDYQTQAAITSLIGGTSLIELQYPARAGKTLSSLLTLLMLNDNSDESNDISYFYGQQKNIEDICKQMINFFPEHCHLLNVANEVDIKLLREQQKKQYMDNEYALIRIPKSIKTEYLNKAKSADKSSPSVILNDEFIPVILNIQEKIKDYNQIDFENFVKEQISNGSPFLKSYFDLMEAANAIYDNDIFRTDNSRKADWFIPATTAVYLNYLHKEDYVSEQHYNNIVKKLIEDYSPIWKDANKKHDCTIRLNICSKTRLDRVVPSEEFMLNRSGGTIRTTPIPLKTLTDLGLTKTGEKLYFNNGGKEIITTDSSIAIDDPFIKNQSDMLLVMRDSRSERTKQIDYHEDSDIKKMAENGKLAMRFVYTRDTSKNPVIRCYPNINLSYEIKEQISKKFDEIAKLYYPDFEDHARVYKATIDSIIDAMNIHLPTTFTQNQYSKQIFNDYMVSVNDILYNDQKVDILSYDINSDIEKLKSSAIKELEKKLEHSPFNEIDADRKKIDTLLKDSLLEVVNNLSAKDIAIDKNIAIIKNLYEDINYIPCKVLDDGSLQRMQKTTDLTMRTFNGNTSSATKDRLTFRFSNLNDTLYGKERATANSIKGAIQAISLSGKVFNLADSKYNNQPLLNASFTATLKTDGFVSYGLEKTKLPIKSSSSHISGIVSGAATTLILPKNNIFENKNDKAKKIAAVDESHKIGRNPDSVSLSSWNKAKTEFESIIGISATPKNSYPNMLYTRAIKNVTPTMLQYLAERSDYADKITKLTHLQSTFKDLVLAYMDTTGKTPAPTDFLETLQKKDKDTFQHIEDFLASYDKISFSADDPNEIVLSKANTFVNRVAQKMAYAINTEKFSAKKGDIPSADWEQIEFYRMARYSEDEIEALLKTELYYNSCPTSGAMFQLSNNKNSTKILKDPYLNYDYVANRGTAIENKELISVFKLASKYFTMNKADKISAVINSTSEIVFNSFTLPTEAQKSQYTEEEIEAIKENQKALKNRLKDPQYSNPPFDDKKLELEEILTSQNKNTKTSAQSIAIDLLLHNGKSMIREDYIDPKIINMLDQKIEFVKNEIIPLVLVYINKERESGAKLTQFTDKDYVSKANTDKSFLVDSANTDYNILIPKNHDYNESFNLDFKIENNDSYNITTDGSTIKTHIEFKWGLDETKKYFPKVASLITENFEPFVQSIVPHSQTHMAFQTLTNKHFTEELEYKIKNNYSCPIFTDRIGTNTFTALKTLELMINNQIKQLAQNNSLVEKNILVLSTNSNSIGLLKSIDKKELRKKYNIDFHIVESSGTLQNKVNELKDLGKKIDLYVLGRRSAAEGIQLYDYTLEDDNYILYPDGAYITTDMPATFQSVSRIDSIALRNLNKEKNGTDELTIPFMAYQQTHKVKWRHSPINNHTISRIFDSGIVDVGTLNKPFMDYISLETNIGDSAIKAKELVIGQLSSYISKPNLTKEMASNFYSAMKQNNINADLDIVGIKNGTSPNEIAPSSLLENSNNATPKI